MPVSKERRRQLYSQGKTCFGVYVADLKDREDRLVETAINRECAERIVRVRNAALVGRRTPRQVQRDRLPLFYCVNMKDLSE